MNVAKLILITLLSVTIICAVLLIKYAYKRRNISEVNCFILLMISAIVYSGAYIGEIGSTNMQTAMLWFYLEHIIIPVQHYLWMLMSLEYCKVSKKYLRIAKYVGLCHPISYLLIFFTNSLHHLYISSYRFENNGYFDVIVSVKGPLYTLMIASGTFLGIISMAFYVRGLIKSSSLHRHGYRIMIVASLLPWIAVYLSAVDRNYLGIDYFPVVSSISGILYMFGIFKFRIFNVIPIATEIVFRQSKEGIMLIDLADYIIDVNDAFISVYPELKYLYPRYTINSFLQNHPELNGINEEKSIFQYNLKQNGNERHYSVVVTNITMDEAIVIGRIVSLNDITIYVENQKMLELIALTAINKANINEISFLQAQIKPHFINNSLSVIGSMITRDPYGARELIGNLGEYLANCYYFDSSSPYVLLEQELETINTYVNIEKARFGERVKFHVVCDEIPEVNIPRLIIQPLVENSIRHGILKKAVGGNVWLIMILEEFKISFEIRDDGVGIFEEKLLGLLNGTSEKQGIGIHNIHKRLLQYYGEGLKINSTEGEGTSITFSIPFN